MNNARALEIAHTGLSEINRRVTELGVILDHNLREACEALDIDWQRIVVHESNDLGRARAMSRAVALHLGRAPR